jgi:serpin B
MSFVRNQPGSGDVEAGMLSRRALLRSAATLPGAVGLGAVLTGCGDDGGTTPRATGYVSADTPRGPGSADRAAAAAAAVAALGVDLYRSLVSEGANLVLSPWSVTVALAMTRTGAVGRTATEMDEVLHGTDLGPGLNWLDRRLHARTGHRDNATGKQGEVGLETASSLWGQDGTTWQPAFLDALATDFGAGMHTVDYRSDASGATRRINAWTADRTHDRIVDLIPDGTLDGLTRLVLVNAIWFKAPWHEAFEPSATQVLPFHRADGTTVDAPMMADAASHASYAEGPGWRAASIPYAGQELAMAVFVPDAGHELSDVETALADGGLARALGSFAQDGAVDLLLPRWRTRTAAPLKEVLVALGMPTAFDPDAADFSGMTHDERLLVQDALHQGFIAVDEKGTEAAAATAVVVGTTSAELPRHVVHADQPFVFAVHDVATRVPLFLGRVVDPTA